MHQKPFTGRAAAVGALALFLTACPDQSGRTQPAGGDPCAADLKKLAFALSNYTQDYDGTLPPMQTAAAFSAALAPYAPSRRVFACPVTGKPYQPNTALSGQVLAKLPRQNTTALLADAAPHPDGRTTTLYADGHIAHSAAAGRPHRKG